MTKTVDNKTDYREVTVCQIDLYTVGLVTGFDDDIKVMCSSTIQCLFALCRFLV